MSTCPTAPSAAPSPASPVARRPSALLSVCVCKLSMTDTVDVSDTSPATALTIGYWKIRGLAAALRMMCHYKKQT